MPRRYTSATVIKKLTAAADGDISNLYKCDVINNIEPTTDTNQPCTEVAAKWLLEHIDVLDKVKQISRHGSYFSRNNRTKNLSRREKFAEEMFEVEYDHIGDIYDVNMPLSDVAGRTEKIDLVACDGLGGDCLYVLGLRPIGNKDTLLHCVLEIYTRWKQLNHKKFISDYVKANGLSDAQAPDRIVPGILVLLRGHQHYQYIMDECEYTRELIKRLGVEGFFWRYQVSKID